MNEKEKYIAVSQERYVTYTVVVYRPDEDDYCMGCYMGGVSSDFDLQVYNDLKGASKYVAERKMEDPRAENKHICHEWEIYVLFNGLEKCDYLDLADFANEDVRWQDAYSYELIRQGIVQEFDEAVGREMKVIEEARKKLARMQKEKEKRDKEAAKKKRAAEKEAKERAQFERLKEKYGDEDK